MFSKAYWGLWALAVGTSQYAVGVAHDGTAQYVVGLIVLCIGAALLAAEWENYRDRR